MTAFSSNGKPKVLIIGEVDTNFASFKQFAEHFDYEVLEAVPASVKIITSCAAGFDSYDAKGLADRGIVLCNTPGLAAEPVADHVLYLTLSLFRYYHVFERLTRAYQHTIDPRRMLTTSSWDLEAGKPKIFDDKRNEADYSLETNSSITPAKFAFGELVAGRFVKTPKGHSVGILGFGAIGKEIGRKLNAIGMNVHYSKRTALTGEEEKELGYPATFHKEIKDLFENSQLLVLACPLNAGTHYVVNEESLKFLPKEARIINIGRGALIDTQAMLAALKSGHLHGVGLDVFEKEPIVEEELCKRWDVIIEPHIGSSTLENVELSEKNCADNIYNMILGDGKSLTRVN
ncbi:hypothetical protein DV451_002721 [Geotrichum candidum]|uniref:D-isomer specific 2-hydroxyacid dehydrogenase NAD-binding domain-containing protein n=1 Tax=Geotrichum candidum TaxID=1173061 RepID=A0A9P5G5P6_GEOCN|nr:hypothetical protein DV451_002721 [Geotrichum candidum]KAF5107920.1 hypothetical protein DV453_002650 [Geotrichum candidum]KAF5112185.1 hypothetical protein DV454_004355 [Geotrichum candidum]